MISFRSMPGASRFGVDSAEETEDVMANTGSELGDQHRPQI
jgi:hypothetical protein